MSKNKFVQANKSHTVTNAYKVTKQWDQCQDANRKFIKRWTDSFFTYRNKICGLFAKLGSFYLKYEMQYAQHQLQMHRFLNYAQLQLGNEPTEMLPAESLVAFLFGFLVAQI